MDRAATFMAATNLSTNTCSPRVIAESKSASRAASHSLPVWGPNSLALYRRHPAHRRAHAAISPAFWEGGMRTQRKQGRQLRRQLDTQNHGSEPKTVLFAACLSCLLVCFLCACPCARTRTRRCVHVFLCACVLCARACPSACAPLFLCVFVRVACVPRLLLCLFVRACLSHCSAFPKKVTRAKNVYKVFSATTSARYSLAC